MSEYIDMILLISAAILIVPGLYLLVLTVAGLLRRVPRGSDEAGMLNKRIAVLIPAHNEENMIGGTIAALLQSHFPEENLGVYVIADNCSDATVLFSRAAGATVFERHDLENPGKGQALDWALAEYDEELSNYDIISILDADTLAHPLFLAEISGVFESEKVEAVQGYYGTSNVEDGWRPALSEVAFAVSHHLRPLGRNALGSTAGLKGNGMAFRAELLLETGWPAHSLVEDLEFTLMLLERGIRVQYCPSARVAAEMVTKSDAATTQRIRWEGGRGQILRMFGPRLIKQMVSGNRMAALESLGDLLFPPMVLYVLPCLAALVAAAATGHWIPAAIVAFGLAIIPIHVITALLHRGVPGKVWKSLLAVPKFILWKIPVYLKIATKGTGSQWLRTRRESEVVEEVEKSESRYLKAASAGTQKHAGLTKKWNDEMRRKRKRWRAHLRKVRGLKRGLDIAASLTAILLLSPLLLITAFLIWLEDRGPIFFFQERVGRFGEPFTMIKFRSMRTDAEKIRRELDEQNQHDVAVTFKIKKDPRITRIGRIIRKFSIDEMPQFFNVLRGDMSMVGPRPALASEVEMYESFQLRRLSVKPGISCLWQVQGRSDIDFEGQVRLDLEYIHSESFLKDVAILFKTVPAVVLARGAY